MRKIIQNKIVIAIAFLSIGLLVGKFVFQKNNTSSNSEIHADHQHAGKAEAPTIWTCAMHPQIQQPEPGDCPICGMELVPLETEMDGSAGPHVLKMSEEAIRIADVHTTILAKGKGEMKLTLQGKIRKDETRLSAQTSHMIGRIEKLYVNFTGQEITKGQRIASVYSPELVTAQEELLEAKKYAHQNPALLKAARNKLKRWKLSELQIAAIETQGAVQTVVDILSDYSGVVTDLKVAIGDYTKDGQVFMEVVDLNRVWVVFDVYEKDVNWIKTGDEIEFTVQSVPGKTFNGKVTFVDPVLNTSTRAVEVRVEVANQSQLLKPGMFVTGNLEAKMEHGDILQIPKTAVLWTGKTAVVYVKDSAQTKPTFHYREIELGHAAGDFYVVENGLEPGEEIVTNGVFKIDAAAQLQGKQSMMNPGNEAVSEARQSYSVAHKNLQVSGNCSMCKNRIEKAAMGLSGVFTANWSAETKMLHLQCDSLKTNLQTIANAIAKAGHDTELKKADTTVYDDLPKCCRYSRED